MAAYYNEIDPFAAKWLRNLIDAGHIAAGKIRRGDIKKLEKEAVENYTQAHFFAGVGVWSYALRCAGWPDRVPVWTGSCPCQPFSQAGRRRGVDDERHLWPTWAKLIEACRPPIIFGEQVASPDGREWLDTVLTQLEGMGYEVGATDLCAAGIGAPHLRQRLYFVAIANGKRRERLRLRLRKRKEGSDLSQARRSGEASELADDAEPRRQSWRRDGEKSNGEDTSREQPRRLRDARGMADTDGSIGDEGRTELRGRDHRSDAKERRRSRGDDIVGLVGDARSARSGRDAGKILGKKKGREEKRKPVGDLVDVARAAGAARGVEDADIADALDEEKPRGWRLVQPETHAARGFWHGADWIFCRDGKWRPVESGTFPLAHGASARVGRLRAYGNAIVAPLATSFIETVMEWLVDG